MEFLKLLSASQIFAQIVTFLFFLFILRIFFWKRVLALLDERRKRIAAELESAQKAQSEAEQLRFEYENRLADIDRAAQVKITEAVEEGRGLIEEARKKAQIEAQGIIERAKEDIRFETAKAMEELKNKVIDLTISATENLLQEKVDDETDRKIVKDFLNHIDGIV
jgi:F-type H+-transporting ATPase subunit b